LGELVLISLQGQFRSAFFSCAAAAVGQSSLGYSQTKRTSSTQWPVSLMQQRTVTATASEEVVDIFSVSVELRMNENNLRLFLNSWMVAKIID
jgi:hypothetical protein